jgi:flagellar basal-body rod protein FlgG
MAVVALHSAATGLSALSREIDVIANNLANVNTTGFKASRVNFEDLLYEVRSQPGVENANGDQRPAGLFVGLGTRISNTQADTSMGSPIKTDGDLDMMIDGPGLFKVRTLADTGNGGVAYTRAGNFFANSNGELVLGNSQGPKLDPPISIPQDVVRVEIAATGEVLAYTAGSVEPTQAGRIQLASFVNAAGLRPVGGNLLVETEASGPPIEGNPGEGQFGTIIQRFLESSNVDPVKELVELIKAQRAFEMNSQSIQAADETLQVVSNLRRM